MAHAVKSLLSLVCALALLLSPFAAGPVAQAQTRGNDIRLIRDAEIEELMRRYLNPIFKVSGINPGAVNIHLIDDSRINAFVAGGQRIFIHTGLLEQAGTPNEVIGVLAHETAHVAGGHLARLGVQLDRASTQAIIAMLLGAAGAVAAAKSGAGGQAGTPLILGVQSVVQPNLLSYVKWNDERTNFIWTIVNFDQYNRQGGHVGVPQDLLGHQGFRVTDLLSGGQYWWNGHANYVDIDPSNWPAHVFLVEV